MKKSLYIFSKNLDDFGIIQKESDWFNLDKYENKKLQEKEVEVTGFEGRDAAIAAFHKGVASYKEKKAEYLYEKHHCIFARNIVCPHTNSSASARRRKPYD